MRIAIVSDIHGNRTAFEAVLADVRAMSPDLILHGGDLADGGSGPVEIVDQILDLGWPGVIGNTDEMLAMPEAFRAFAEGKPALRRVWDVVEETAAAAREALGADRLAWLGRLPKAQVLEGVALVHASPESRWTAPGPEASDAELERVYGTGVVVYGHIHRGFVRALPGLTLVNAGSVSLSYDGDPRASYVLLDDGTPEIRRVEYDVEKEIRALEGPHAEWIGKCLRSGQFQMP